MALMIWGHVDVQELILNLMVIRTSELSLRLRPRKYGTETEIARCDALVLLLPLFQVYISLFSRQSNDFWVDSGFFR